MDHLILCFFYLDGPWIINIDELRIIIILNVLYLIS